MDFKMPIYEYKEGMDLKEQADGAYWERNMLALTIAIRRLTQDLDCKDGWYYDTDNNWKGWQRVISLFDGAMTFHVPDSFDLGVLPRIKQNWDGSDTIEKWKNAMSLCGCSQIEDYEVLMEDCVCQECGGSLYMEKEPIDIRPERMPVHAIRCANEHRAYYFLGNTQRKEKENEDGPVHSRVVFPNTYGGVDPVSKDYVLEEEN